MRRSALDNLCVIDLETLEYVRGGDDRGGDMGFDGGYDAGGYDGGAADYSDYGAQNASDSGNSDFLGASNSALPDYSDYGAHNASGTGNDDFLGPSPGSLPDFTDFGADNASGTGNNDFLGAAGSSTPSGADFSDYGAHNSSDNNNDFLRGVPPPAEDDRAFLERVGGSDSVLSSEDRARAEHVMGAGSYSDPGAFSISAYMKDAIKDGPLAMHMKSELGVSTRDGAFGHTTFATEAKASFPMGGATFTTTPFYEHATRISDGSGVEHVTQGGIKVGVERDFGAFRVMGDVKLGNENEASINVHAETRGVPWGIGERSFGMTGSVIPPNPNYNAFDRADAQRILNRDSLAREYVERGIDPTGLLPRMWDRR
jgi:hypothetical protein